MHPDTSGFEDLEGAFGALTAFTSVIRDRLPRRDCSTEQSPAAGRAPGCFDRGALPVRWIRRAGAAPIEVVDNPA